MSDKRASGVRHHLIPSRKPTIPARLLLSLTSLHERSFRSEGESDSGHKGAASRSANLVYTSENQPIAPALFKQYAITII